ncbi:Pentatricopeptide repeat-containing protein [Hibiscus syriacus]|uniref:Pentatricopeptide repeat-containing protein n=1 Tax=Hibiscus syriacus TaxID=106335 RepID=A0A6A2YAZ0_HIBSY|nr:Pentatricopeptide repeat-containing protein [Hibiscus syriacus]
MELGAAESVDLPYYSSIKVHRLMCSELKKLIDSVSYMFSALEAARPRCTPGVRALCTLQSAMDKANLLIQHCSESSKFDLIAGIIEELTSARFSLEPSEYDAGAVILALLERDISASASKMQSEIEALRLAALRLSITSPFSLLREKISIRKLLGRVKDANSNNRKILKYLLYLLKKHELIWQLQSKNMEEESILSLMEEEEEAVWIEKWFSEGNQICPVTITTLKQLSLTPNFAMKALVSKWLLRHGINVPQHAKPVPSLISLHQPSSSCIASLGSTVLGLLLEIGSTSHDSVSTNSSLDSLDGKCNNEIMSRLSKVAVDSHSRIRQHHSSKISSSDGIHAACLSELINILGIRNARLFKMSEDY